MLIPILGKKCFKHSADASWVPTIQENTPENTTLRLYVSSTSNIPNDINDNSWSCKTDKVVWIYNNSTPLKKSFAEGIKIRNDGNKTLQVNSGAN